MPPHTDRDYVLGTHDEELARLGLQHRLWRPHVLECWKRAGVGAGWRVLDVGAGPGYATVDLAEIVGPSGHVLALERSARFLEAARAACRERGLSNVDLREHDLMVDPLDALDDSGFDASWCRWVACFVSSPSALVAKIAGALRVGGVAMFHEYVDYETIRLVPARPEFEAFIAEVVKSWRATGGEPDAARVLPQLLVDSGFRLRHLTPLVWALAPSDPRWQWPATFVEIYLGRLLDLGRVERAWVEGVRQAFREAEADPATVLITPLVLEIIAERVE